MKAVLFDMDGILIDTEKYLKIIEERNRELEKQKNEGKPEEDEEVSIYANRQTEIKINQEYLDKLGLSVIDETEKEVEADKGVSYADDDDEEDEEDDEEDEDDDEDGDGLIEYECPHCGTVIFFDENAFDMEEEHLCPNCHRKVFEDDGEDGDDEE